MRPTYALGLLALALPLCAAGAPVPKTADKPQGYFPTKVGDKWVYA